MRATTYEGRPGRLEARDLPVPVPGPRQLLLRVRACGVCRTDLHLVDGELPHPKWPVVPRHEIVGIVADFRLDSEVTEVPLADAQRALDDLRGGRLVGAAVLRCAPA